MRIAIIGAGYVGLVTGACLANLGHQIHVWDTDIEKIATLRAGVCPIHEPGLERWIPKMQYHHIDEAPEFVFDVFYIAVGTPTKPDWTADVSYVASAARWIRAQRALGVQTIVIKSTVPPGTARAVRMIVGDEFDVVSNPEFLKEGSAMADFQEPDRVVIGTDQGKAPGSPFWVVAKEIYRGSGIAQCKFLSMTNESAELAKYANNGMLATRISFMNEMSRVSHAVGADIDDIKLAVGCDSRIGDRFLNPGPGWGGSCFPKDVSALSLMGGHMGGGTISCAAITGNRDQQEYIVHRAMGILGDEPGRVCVWGAAFKPGTDDTRESPALSIMQKLRRNHGCKVTVHDPVARVNIPGVTQCDDMYEATVGADLIIHITDWPQYRTADWGKVYMWMTRGKGVYLGKRTVFDTRNVLNQHAVRQFLELERL